MATAIMMIVIYAISNADPNKPTLIAASVIFLIGFEIGPGPCFYVCCMESFPAQVRGRCLGYSYTIMQIANIIIVLTFPFFSSVVYGVYLMYLIVTLISTIILGFYMVETKGKTLEEIEAIMTGEKPKENDVDMTHNVTDSVVIPA